MSMLRKSSFHGHYCLNTANVWKILSQNIPAPGLCIQEVEYANPESCRIIAMRLRMGEHGIENELHRSYKLSSFQAPSLSMRSQGPGNPVLFSQSLLPADFQLPGKELGWEKRNLSFDPIAQTFITVLFLFFFTPYRTKSGKIRKKFFQKRHVLYLISIERRVGDRNVIIPKYKSKFLFLLYSKWAF